MSGRDKLLKTIFDEFLLSNNFSEILLTFDKLCEIVDLNPSDDYPTFYKQLKSKLKIYWKAQPLLNKLDKKYNQKEYKKQGACQNINVLIVGAGPCGLRCSIELALLGARVVLIEKRNSFSRNNVLHLWPYVISDLNQLGAKKFFGLFCSGSINHISIKRLQSILLKVALLLGVQIYENVNFEKLLPPGDIMQCVPISGEGDQLNNELNKSQNQNGWQVQVAPLDHIVNQYQFDVVIGANGKSNLLNFKRKELRCKLAIAITVNFVNNNTPEEVHAEEISGIVCIFNQQYFKSLYNRTGIDLENIVYYKDETHYFVMTVKKHCLLTKQVLKQDHDNPEQLLSSANVDLTRLQEFAREAAMAATNYTLPNLEFSKNHRNEPDVAMFDFTRLFAAEYASRIVERNGYPLLQALIGDSLLEPFWPTGSGCALGFLSSLDAAWLVRRIGIIKSALNQGKIPREQVLSLMLEAIAERENIYQRLSQTTPKNMPPNFNSYTLNPKTRYSQCRMKVFGVEQVLHLYDTDQVISKNDLKTSGQGIKIKFRDESKDVYFEKEKLLRWFQIKLSFLAQQYDFRIKTLQCLIKTHLPLKCFISLYKPDCVNLEITENDDIAGEFKKILSIFESEFNIKPTITVEQLFTLSKFESLSMSDMGNCNGEIIINSALFEQYVAFLNIIWRQFKTVTPISIDSATNQLLSPTSKKSNNHLKRLSSNRRHHHHNHHHHNTPPSSVSSPKIQKQFLTSALKRILIDKDRINNNTSSSTTTTTNIVSKQKIDQISMVQARSKEIMEKYRDSNYTTTDSTFHQKSQSSSKISSLAEKVLQKQEPIKKSELAKSNVDTTALNKQIQNQHNQKDLNSNRLKSQLSEECCYFCKKYVEEIEREEVKQLSHSKRCICRQCCQELKLGVFSGLFNDTNQDSNTNGLDKSITNDVDEVDSKHRKWSLTEEELLVLLRKCLLDLRRVNDESDEDYNGSCEDQLLQSISKIEDSNEIGLFTWSNFNQTRALEGCKVILRSRLEPGDNEYGASSSSEEDVDRPPPITPLLAKCMHDNDVWKDKSPVVTRKNTSDKNRYYDYQPESVEKVQLQTDEKPNHIITTTNTSIQNTPDLITMTTVAPLKPLPPLSLETNSRSLTNLHQTILTPTSPFVTTTNSTSTTTATTLIHDSTLPRASKSHNSASIQQLSSSNTTLAPDLIKTDSDQNKTMKHLAKFKFCSEPPKPLSINPKNFISDMNKKKLQKVDLGIKIKNIQILDPICNMLLSIKQGGHYLNNKNDDKNYIKCSLHKLLIKQSSNYYNTNTQSKSKPATQIKTVSSTSPKLTINEDSQKNITISPTPIKTPITITAPTNKLLESFLNTEEFKDIDSLSINTEDSLMTDSISKEKIYPAIQLQQQTKTPQTTQLTKVNTPKLIVYESNIQSNKSSNNNNNNNNNKTSNLNIKMKATLESDLEKMSLLDSSSINNLIITGNSILACTTSSSSSSLGSVSDDELDTNSEKEQLFDDIDEQNKIEINNNNNNEDKNNNNEDDKKSLHSRSSFRRKLTHKKHGNLHNIDDNSNHNKTKTTSPPHDVQLTDNQVKCQEIECTNDPANSLLKFTDISEMCKKLENIEYSLDVSEN